MFQQKNNRKSVIIAAVICCGLGIAVGVVIGWFAHKNNVEEEDNSSGHSHRQGSTEELLKKGREYLIQHLNKENIRSNLKNYTSKPRLPGSTFSLELSDELAAVWKQNGLDVVNVPAYDVLLSYPNKSMPNELEIIFSNGTSTGIKSAAYEKPLDKEGNNKDVVPPYNSFAPSGVAEGHLVYVNYARIEDFHLLTSKLMTNLSGHIAIARYGKIYRGDKVKNAQRFNMAGIVMYTDPSDFNIANSSVYPNSWWMPDTGVQRGTVGFDGDYLTPLYPAAAYAHRKKKEDVLDIKIPAQPISYGDAKKFLERMQGKDAPDHWKGKLNITYKIGPGFTDTNLKVRLSVHNYEEVSTVKNVIGYIKGSHEPDRYVLMGNHHDAWVFGAIDPLSGAAAATELTRVFGQMVKEGMRPRRTLVFCSWGDEEQGLVGSTEWVEEHMKVLYERGVAYLNVDYAADYVHHLDVGTSPLLQDPIYNAAKMVPNPTPSREYPMLYDIWLNRTKTDRNEPSVYYNLGSGSDMATFYQRAGVPSLDMWYTYDYDRWDILSYPLYHSAYETFQMFTSYIDPSFNYTLAVGQLSGVFLWNLANEDILGFDVRRYPAAIQTFITSLEKEFGTLWESEKVNIEALKSAADNFTQAAKDFYQALQNIDKDNPLACRIVNDKQIQLERAFIDPEGLPNRPMYKHVMFAPSQFDSYSDNSFPGIVDTMYGIQHNNTDNWDLLKHQVYVATYIIQGAAETLQDTGL